jgi:hypothetical protein
MASGRDSIAFIAGREVHLRRLGTDIFTVRRDDPNAGIHVCGGPNARSLVGYLCSTKDLGAARACRSCGS